MNALTCSHPRCLRIRDEAPRRPGEDPGLCAYHRQQDRTRRGVCLNCGAPLQAGYELNALTGRPLRRAGREVVVRRCASGCGYTRRTRPARRRSAAGAI